MFAALCFQQPFVSNEFIESLFKKVPILVELTDETGENEKRLCGFQYRIATTGPTFVLSKAGTCQFSQFFGCLGKNHPSVASIIGELGSSPSSTAILKVFSDCDERAHARLLLS